MNLYPVTIRLKKMPSFFQIKHGTHLTTSTILLDLILNGSIIPFLLTKLIIFQKLKSLLYIIKDVHM